MPSVWQTHKAEIYVRVKGILYNKSNESPGLWGMTALDQQICLRMHTSVLYYASRFFSPITSKEFFKILLLSYTRFQLASDSFHRKFKESQ